MDLYEFGAILVYKVSSMPVRARLREMLSLKKKFLLSKAKTLLLGIDRPEFRKERES